ncbi:MAG TPA: NAD(P)-dependent oxidoreductase [Magnetospirillaceae bacterium]
MEIGWIGIGRMGAAMAERVLKAKHPLKVWNRTRSKAEPLAKLGATIVDSMEALRGADVVITMLSTGKDLAEVCFGKGGLAADDAAKVPGIIVDCSTIGMEESKEIRDKLAAKGVQFLAAPVSGNPKCVVAGKLSCIVSGPKAAFDKVDPILGAFAVRGVTYAGDGDLARICKIAHNVFLGVVIENLIEITLLAEKAGVPRHAFLKFMNNSVMGSVFTQYKSPALANLDFTTTFTVPLLRKDLDLGLDAAHKMGVAMPITTATREVLQSHYGIAKSKTDPEAYLAQDFATLIETLALHSGMTVTPDNVPVPSGLEV